jgi:prepilin-type N-terminal cleavage/methylation domain-containing protein/prepilin-type processing-associated H-X9-DG protein
MSTCASPNHFSSRARPPRGGFTLVELLVVIAIIGILVALLLPAIQAAREAARRSQCSNNLKQIALGLMNYHDTHNTFPAGWNQQSPGGQPEWGWAVMILPFTEQATLYEELNPTERRLNQLYYASAPADLQRLLQTPIKTYRCPSDTLKVLNTVVNFGGTNHFRIATSNYVANIGTGSQTGTAENNGVFYGNSWLGVKDILDGTSQTLAVGERSASHLAAHWAGVGSNNSINNEHQARATARGGFVINFDYVAAGSPENRAKGYASYHPGGTQFAMCDGAVRFVSQNTNGIIVQRMAMRNDGEAINLP